MRRVWMLAGTGGTCIAVACCAAALGGVGAKTVTVPQRAVVSATAKCPAGERATGGGWESTPSVSSDVQVFPMESRKVGQRRWRVTGAQNSPNPNVDATMRAIVYCSANAPRTVAKTKTVGVPSDGLSYRDANARCGKAGRVQAGGFSAPTNTDFNPFVSVLESKRVKGNSWRVRGIAYGDDPLLTSYAYCADQPAPSARAGTPKSRIDTVDQVTVVSGSCGKGSTLVAGGMTQTAETPSPYSDFEGFYESFRVGGRWHVSGSHYGESAGALQAIAYCD